MRPSKLFREATASRAPGWDEKGSAAIEFIVAGMILLIPLVYLTLAMANIQSGAFAVEGAARQAARVYVRSTTVKAARSNSEAAVRFALADYGVTTNQATVRISCRPRPDDCLSRRGFVTVRVRAVVPLPLSPPAIGGNSAVSVPVSATATQQVSRFSESN